MPRRPGTERPRRGDVTLNPVWQLGLSFADLPSSGGDRKLSSLHEASLGTGDGGSGDK